jgi:hypothetical protein
MGGTVARANDVGPAAYPTCNATAANLVGSYRYRDLIELDVYWDAANGTNCAYAYHGPDVPRGSGGRLRISRHAQHVRQASAAIRVGRRAVGTSRSTKGRTTNTRAR